MRAALETLLRARKLDVTLTARRPLDEARGRPAWRRTGCAALDAALGGGLRRGHLSEIVGDVSSGRTTLIGGTARGGNEAWRRRAIVDAGDTFDPPSAAAVGLDLSRLLWVRDRGRRDTCAQGVVPGSPGRRLRLVVFDLADVPSPQLRPVPVDDLDADRAR